MCRKLWMPTFRFSNNRTLFLKTTVQDTSINIAKRCQGLSAAYNECHFFVFNVIITYLRFYRRYLNNFCIVRNQTSSPKARWKNPILRKIRHAPHFDKAPHICRRESVGWFHTCAWAHHWWLSFLCIVSQTDWTSYHHICQSKERLWVDTLNRCYINIRLYYTIHTYMYS